MLNTWNCPRQQPKLRFQTLCEKSANKTAQVVHYESAERSLKFIPFVLPVSQKCRFLEGNWPHPQAERRLQSPRYDCSASTRLQSTNRQWRRSERHPSCERRGWIAQRQLSQTQQRRPERLHHSVHSAGLPWTHQEGWSVALTILGEDERKCRDQEVNRSVFWRFSFYNYTSLTFFSTFFRRWNKGKASCSFGPQQDSWHANVSLARMESCHGDSMSLQNTRHQSGLQGGWYSSGRHRQSPFRKRRLDKTWCCCHWLWNQLHSW